MKNMIFEFFDCRIIAESYSTSFPDINHISYQVLFKDYPTVMRGELFLPNDDVSIPESVARNIYSAAKERLSANLRTPGFFELLWRRYLNYPNTYVYAKICDDKLF